MRSIPNATNEQISAIIEGVQRGTLGKIEFSDLPADGKASQRAPRPPRPPRPFDGQLVPQIVELGADAFREVMEVECGSARIVLDGGPIETAPSILDAALQEPDKPLPDYFDEATREYHEEQARAERISPEPRSEGFEGERVWSEPKPLPGGLAPVPVFKQDYLPDNIAPWVMDISDRMQCPPELVAIPVLTSLGSLMGRKCGVRPEQNTDWTEFPNIWGCTIARSGSLKSPAMQDALKPLGKLEAEAHKQFASDRAEYERELEEYKLNCSAARSNAREAAKKGKAVKLDLDAAPAEPKAKRYLTNDSSYQQLGVMLEANSSILVIRDELVSLLRHLDQEQNSDARGFYMTGWNGNSPYTFDRIGRGTIRIEAVCISVCGSSTPGAMAEYVRRANSGGAGDDGMMQRFNLAVWPDQAGEWKPADRGLNLEARNRAYDVFQALDELTPTSMGQVDPYGGPPFLRFDARAQAAFIEWRTPFERLLRSDHLHSALASHFAKYRKLVPALALINHVCAGGRTDPIAERSLRKVIEFYEYLKSHARRIYGSRREAEVAAAKAIMARIQVGVLTDGFTARDIHQKDWSSLTDIEHVKMGLDLLVDHDWIATNSRDSTPQKGRPTLRYVINPMVPKK